ncbi:MAG TPA: SAM-dependent methyltransferase [Streptosporangiaceae bacterium]|nr:SAM-dependent methyltransferase [Streptosporangiaceae bacterium]
MTDRACMAGYVAEPVQPAADAAAGSASSPVPHPHGALRNTDASTPNVARIYDTLLGGQGNPAIDQEAAGELLRLVPGAVMAAYQNRNFLQRAVQLLASQAGVRQFIDIGMGLPTHGNVHEFARRAAPHARVLYVDYDPAVISRAQAVLAGSRGVAAINRDLRDPDGIIGHPALRALINFDEPVAVLLTAVLHFIKDDEDPHAIVNAYKDAIVPGSYLTLSHFTGDGLSPEATHRVRELYQNATAPVVPRTHAEITRFLDGLEILPPGLVNGSAWRAGYMAAEPRRTIFYAGVARKR